MFQNEPGTKVAEVNTEPKPLLQNATVLIKGENTGASLTCRIFSDLCGHSFVTKVS